MTKFLPQYWARQFGAALSLIAALAACKSDSSGTGPRVAAAITADAATSGQVAPAGTPIALPVVVHVFDLNGNPVSGAKVAWAVVHSAGVLGDSISTTDATGMSNMVWTLDSVPRVDSVVASIQSGASVTITATGTIGAVARDSIVSGDAQTVASGTTSAPFVIKVMDRFGNAIQGVVVGWAQTGGGTLSAASTTTDVNGMAQVTMTLGATPGPYTITATAGALAALTFNLTGN
jgi:adhesin/invasin